MVGAGVGGLGGIGGLARWEGGERGVEKGGKWFFGFWYKNWQSSRGWEGKGKWKKEERTKLGESVPLLALKTSALFYSRNPNTLIRSYTLHMSSSDSGTSTAPPLKKMKVEHTSEDTIVDRKTLQSGRGLMSWLMSWLMKLLLLVGTTVRF